MSGVDLRGYSLDNALAAVGKGWATLIQRLYVVKPAHIDIIQVKEKYGGLRVYTNEIDDDFERLIGELEARSYNICEDCGADGKLTTDRGWMLTLCPTHMKEKDRS